MTGHRDPWALPGLRRWLDEVSRHLAEGLAVIATDPSRPPNMLDALRDVIGRSVTEIRATRAELPAAVLAEAFGTAPTLEALLRPGLDQELGVLRLADADGATYDGWTVFLQRFADACADGRGGPCLLVVDPPREISMPPGCTVKGWRTNLRRGDLVIWAEEHLPATRDGLAAEVAVALAVELCGWRLDLAAALVQASLDDLAAPVDWLARRTERRVDGGSPACPLAVREAGQKAELHQRVWRAQLAAFFPALESWRIDIVAAFAAQLRVDDHLRSLGVHSVEELELGALRYQLKHLLSRSAAERLETLANARNALAHCEPVHPFDAMALLREVVPRPPAQRGN